METYDGLTYNQVKQAFQKNLIVWKLDCYGAFGMRYYVVSEELNSVETYYDYNVPSDLDIVSEELNSVETPVLAIISKFEARFQKNLIVWKP